MKIDDEVRIIGPARHESSTSAIGKTFKIEEIYKFCDGVYYSADHVGWYPESSLTLCKPFKIGDRVRIKAAEHGAPDSTIGNVGTVTEIEDESIRVNREWWYASGELVLVEDAPRIEDTIGFQAAKCASDIEEAMEAVRNILAPLVDKRLASIEKQLADMQAVVGYFCGKQNDLEACQKEQQATVRPCEQAIASDPEPELKVGGWAQVIKTGIPSSGKIKRVVLIDTSSYPVMLDDQTWYRRGSIRVLSPEEIARRLNENGVFPEDGDVAALDRIRGILSIAIDSGWLQDGTSTDLVVLCRYIGAIKRLNERAQT